MDDAKIQQLCNDFLVSLGAPGFVMFGRQEGDEWKVTYSLHEMPVKIAVGGILSAANRIVQENLP